MTPEERREVLAMVASGKMSAGDASTLLQSDETAKSVKTSPDEKVIPVQEERAEPVEKQPVPPAGQPDAPAKRGRWLHIHVNDLKSGNRRVSVNVPLGLVRAGLALGESVVPERGRFSWNDFTSALLDEQGGMIVEVKDEEDGEHVQIFVD